MLRFLGLIVLLAGSFGLGYMTGQMPLHPLSEKVRELSRNVLDTTLGMERGLRQRQGLLDAKAHLVQAKAHLVDHNYGYAGKELGEAVEAFNQVMQSARDTSAGGTIRALSHHAGELQGDLSSGKKLAPAKLDTLHRDLDDLLKK